jgi:hypothetical protein
MDLEIWTISTQSDTGLAISGRQKRFLGGKSGFWAANSTFWVFAHAKK